MKGSPIYIALIIFLATVQGTGCHHHEDEVPLIYATKSLAEWFQSSCIMLLHTEQLFVTDYHRIRSIFEQLAADFNGFITVNSMDFQKFFSSYGDSKRAIKCNSPFLLVVHSDNGTKQQLEELTEKMTLQNVYWLLFINTSVEKFFEKIDTPFDIQMFVARIKHKEYVEFFEVYRVARGHPLRIPRFGQWTKEKNLEAPTSIVYNRRHDLEGIVLRTGSTENEPIHWFEKTGDGRPQLRGYFPAVWRELEEMLNFTSINYPSVDNVTGIPEENGNWSGLVGMLQRKEIDVAVSEFIMDEQRTHVLDFSRPLLKSSYQIFFQNVGNDFNWDAILRPFGTDAWLAILSWIIIGSIFLSVCHYYSHNYGLEHSTKSQDFNLINSLFFFTRVLCNQGHTSVPSSVACRIIYISAYLVTGVLLPSYSAALISYLTSKTPKRPFDSLHELLSVGTYKLQTNAKTAEYTYFSNATDPLLRKLFEKFMKRIPEGQLPLNTKEALQKVCKDPYLAHFGDTEVAKSYVNKINNDEKNRCNIMTLSQPISTIYSCMALVRKSPYRAVINHFLQKMEDTGIVDELLDKSVHYDKWSRPVVWSEVDSNDVIPMFLLLMAGMFLSALFFLIERILRRRHVDKAARWQHKPPKYYS